MWEQLLSILGLGSGAGGITNSIDSGGGATGINQQSIDTQGGMQGGLGGLPGGVTGSAAPSLADYVSKFGAAAGKFEMPAAGPMPAGHVGPQGTSFKVPSVAQQPGLANLVASIQARRQRLAQLGLGA